MKEKLILTKIPLFAMIILIMGATLLLPATGSCFQVTARVDKTRIAPGDRISLQVVVDGGKAMVDLSPILDFKILSSGTSSSQSYSNGQWQRQVIYRYLLVPEKTGLLKIPPLPVSREKQTFKTKQIQITVSKMPLPETKSRQLFVQAHVVSSDLMVGQQTVYTVKLFAAARFANASLKAPVFDPFAAQELKERKNYTQTINGISYLVNEISYILQAEKPGRFKIGPAVIMADLIQQSGSNPMDSFFNDSFFPSARTKSVQVASSSVTLGVRPLPPYTGGTPFSGLVGQFTMGAGVDKPKLLLGESATLTLIIQGKGNIMDAGPPPLNLDPGLVKVYDDTPTEEMTASSIGFSGKKIFKRALVPRQAGALVIPAFALTYFDVEARKYKTIKTDEIDLDVIGGASVLTTDSRVGDNPASKEFFKTDAGIGLVGQKQEVAMVNKDILDIKDSFSILSSPFQFKFSLFVLLVLAPGLLYGCIAFIFRFYTRERSNETLMTQRSGQSLKTAAKLAALDKPFLNHVQAGLVAAILAKADKQAENLTCDEARQILQQNGTEPGVIDEVVSMLETLDATRFGGQIMDNSKVELSFVRVKRLIKMLCITLCCLGVFSHYCSFAFAKDGVGTNELFLDGIKSYQAGEFKDAANNFESIAASGVINPDLFYNIGNAYLKAKDLGNAILWYERAKRLSPGNPDLLFNLAYANTLVKDKIDSSLTLRDILFFWQGVVPLKWIQTGTIVFSCLFFLWAGVKTFRRKRIFSGVGWVLISLLVGSFIAAGMEEYRVQVENSAVIVQTAAAVRSGIMESSTKLFELHAGTRVQVEAKKKGYLKIRLPKGRVGWVRPGDAKVI
ncbi:MAG: hypothetical protein GY710_17630 [Desulfobacteraceae bacterium]|nr:hypothetical protein [Desulfobacteraceae bacterium]